MISLVDILENIIKTRKILEDLLSLERLDRLANKNTFIATAYAEALMHSNYHLLSWDEPTYMTIIQNPIVPIPTTKRFPLTIEGKLAAIGQSFAHSAGKLDNILSMDTFVKLTGMVEVAADIAKAVLQASRVSQQLGVPPGYTITQTPKLKKVKP